jgi:hypothetical protein
MKKVFQLKAVALFAVALLISVSAFAQQAKVIPSPRDSVSGKIGAATVSINYGSPSVKGRKIFGGLEAYDKVWRAGANEATTFTTDKAIKIEGKDLPAGKYTLFATPNEKEWTIILNSQVGQWGIKRDHTANLDPAKNVVVVTVKPKQVPLTERLKYDITSKGFSLTWETTQVWVSVK